MSVISIDITSPDTVDSLRRERDELIRHLAASKAEQIRLQEVIRADAIERIRLRAGLREATAYVECLNESIDELYKMLDEAAAAMPEARAESVKVRAAVEQWKALVQP